MGKEQAIDWAIVAAVVVCFILIPVAIVLRPPGIPFRVAFIVFPLIPALGLALFAVWYALRRR